jgi:hypothetical protein
MILTRSAPLVARLTMLDRSVIASVSAMSVFALFSPLFWGLG